MEFVALRTATGALLDGTYVPGAAVDRARQVVAGIDGTHWVGRAGSGVLVCAATHDPRELVARFAGELVDVVSMPIEESLCVLVSDHAPESSLDGVLLRLFGDPFFNPSLVNAAPVQFLASDTVAGPLEWSRQLADRLQSGQQISGVVCGDRRVASVSGALALVDTSAVVGVRDLMESVVDPVRVRGRAQLAPVGSLDDGPARRLAQVIGLGFQFFAGRLQGPRDLFADRCFDAARAQAWARADLHSTPVTTQSQPMVRVAQVATGRS